MEEAIVLMWVAVAVMFIIMEMFTAGFFVFWFGLGAGAAATTAMVSDNYALQLVVFLVVSAIGVMYSRKFAARVSSGPIIPSNVDALIGKTGIVVDDILPSTGKGKIRVETEIWRAVSREKTSIELNSEVRIDGVDGVRLIVSKVES
jgi:membrane protein implicated in regulation of membrane protease activity